MELENHCRSSLGPMPTHKDLLIQSPKYKWVPSGVGVPREDMKNTHWVTLEIDTCRKNMTGLHIKQVSRPCISRDQDSSTTSKSRVASQDMLDKGVLNTKGTHNFYSKILGRVLIGLSPFSGTVSYLEEFRLNSILQVELLNWSKKHKPTQIL